jgi:hypothetical protein
MPAAWLKRSSVEGSKRMKRNSGDDPPDFGMTRDGDKTFKEINAFNAINAINALNAVRFY